MAIHYTTGWLVFLYFAFSAQRWTVYLYSTLLYVTTFLYHTYYRLAKYIKCGQFFSITDIVLKGGQSISILTVICDNLSPLLLSKLSPSR